MQTAFDVKSKDTLREIAQSLQEGRKMARSIETLASSLMPLSTKSTEELLSKIEEEAMTMARVFQRLYNGIAKEALGE